MREQSRILDDAEEQYYGSRVPAGGDGEFHWHPSHPYSHPRSRKHSRKREPARRPEMMSEDDLLRCVIDLAHVRGWLAFHPRPGWLGNRWSTPLSGDAGFPDLVLARRGVVLVRELKSATGVVEPAQCAWLNACHGDVRDDDVWRPEQWHNGTIERVLR